MHERDKEIDSKIDEHGDFPKPEHVYPEGSNNTQKMLLASGKYYVDLDGQLKLCKGTY